MKSVFVIWDDLYHPVATYKPFIEKLFPAPGWDCRTTLDARELFSTERRPDLVMNLTVGRPDGQTDLSTDEQARVRSMVEEGMGAIYLHGGLACVQDDTPVFDVALGRFASHPEPHYSVRCSGIPGIDHPIMESIEAFEASDEHYFCRVDLDRARPFLAAVSEAGTEVAGWTQELGAGRVCSITPGHTPEMLAKIGPLVANAAEWCTRGL